MRVSAMENGAYPHCDRCRASVHAFAVERQCPTCGWVAWRCLPSQTGQMRSDETLLPDLTHPAPGTPIKCFWCFSRKPTVVFADGGVVADWLADERRIEL
jgi:predicted RNA-binding Zn-ribbon protein involved in translation (DUF1610 family)